MNFDISPSTNNNNTNNETGAACVMGAMLTVFAVSVTRAAFLVPLATLGRKAHAKTCLSQEIVRLLHHMTMTFLL